MSGPIVRSGPSPEFSQNWEKIFGVRTPVALAGKKSAAAKPAGSAKAQKKVAKPAPAAKPGGAKAKKKSKR